MSQNEQLADELHKPIIRKFLLFGVLFWDIVMYSTHNEGKPIVAERFIKTLKNKIHNT